MLGTITIGMACFAAGLWLGGHLVNRKWAANALEPMRIEYRGILYKVHVDRETSDRIIHDDGRVGWTVR